MRRQRDPATAREAAEMRMRRRQRTRGFGRQVPPRAAYRGQADPSVRPRRWRLPKPTWGPVGQPQEALQNTVEEILARDKKLVSDFWRGMVETPRLQALRVCTSTHARARASGPQATPSRQARPQASKQTNKHPRVPSGRHPHVREEVFSLGSTTQEARQIPATFRHVQQHATCRLRAAAILWVFLREVRRGGREILGLVLPEERRPVLQGTDVEYCEPSRVLSALPSRPCPSASAGSSVLSVGLRRLVGIGHHAALLSFGRS